MECIYCYSEHKPGESCPRCSVMTLDEAMATLGNAVYRAAIYFEHLEGLQLVIGNGHHMAQSVSGFATDLLKERWRGKE